VLWGGCIHSKKIIHFTYFQNIPVPEFLKFLVPLVEKWDLQTITKCRFVISQFSQHWNLYILFNMQNFSSLCSCVNSK